MSRKLLERKPKTPVPPRSTEVFNGILSQMGFCAKLHQDCIQDAKDNFDPKCAEETVQCMNGLITVNNSNGMKG